MPRLTLKAISKRFDRFQALDAVSLAIPDGAFLALLGPSGCGKTTLLRLIAGLEVPDHGEIRFDEHVVAGSSAFVPPEQRRIGMVFQSYALWPTMSVRGNIEFGLKVARLTAQERAARIDEVLDVVGLRGLGDRRPHELSGGQRQRVALARSLATRPQLILLDEPLANLDAHLRETMLAEFRRIHSLTGATFVFVTHDQDEAMAVASHVAVMDRGRLEQVGTPEELYRRPASPMVARFIGRGRTLPVRVVRSEGGQTRVMLGQQFLDMPGDAPVGYGWLSFHASDLRRVAEGGHLKTELVGQVFQNGAFLSHCLPSEIDGDVVSVPLAERLAPGTPIDLAFTGGWVIGDGDTGHGAVDVTGRSSACRPAVISLR
ncbi:ABC transporter ATP-binding protein [Peteryoungia algae]|uniref:ABC transporter ATP-binding protein n=1 Tax=Peteryoungia algae TaxID=2919917 RepID=A0ABT0CX89_9HYPH|nr:ABC transporter ATP-binding protein [Rhizobium sp. SSM4.3]MCJ8237781.1 ABC transporter ATP-binding protein [Rhizobium sp. SSM4.3]